MEIYILRHGIAEDPKPGQSDASRLLTGEGKEKLARILSRARKAGLQPDAILSSPYRRAVETAEIAREVLKVEAPILQTPALAPMEPPERIWGEIREHRDAKQVLLTGHEPHVSRLVEFLTGGRVAMKKGAIARVDVASIGPHPSGELVWLLIAKLAN